MSAETQEIEIKLACGAQHAAALRKHVVLEHPVAGGAAGLVVPAVRAVPPAPARM